MTLDDTGFKRLLSGGGAWHLDPITNLDSVTSATNGATIDVKAYSKKTMFIEVTGNTGAVTVTMQGSYNKTTWFNAKDANGDVVTATYTSTNANEMFVTSEAFPYMRVITSTQSSSTVKATVYAHS